MIDSFALNVFESHLEGIFKSFVSPPKMTRFIQRFTEYIQGRGFE